MEPFNQLEIKAEIIQPDGIKIVVPYKGKDYLYRHGAIKASDNKKYLQHEDGTPFFWLGGTWWMGFTKRLSWPDDFQELAWDRMNKGYNIIQIVAVILS